MNETNHNYNTRLNKQVKPQHLDFLKEKTKFMGKTFFYNLLKNVLLEQNLHKFKNKLKEHLTGLALYSTEEFFSNLEAGCLFDTI